MHSDPYFINFLLEFLDSSKKLSEEEEKAIDDLDEAQIQQEIENCDFLASNIFSK